MLAAVGCEPVGWSCFFFSEVPSKNLHRNSRHRQSSPNRTPQEVCLSCSGQRVAKVNHKIYRSKFRIKDLYYFYIQTHNLTGESPAINYETQSLRPNSRKKENDCMLGT